MNINDNFTVYAPIAKVDKEKRLVYGFATTESLDQSAEIVAYEASKKAFSEWSGNIREMHQDKAIGTAIEIIPDDEKKGIFVVSKVSKGAEDTWQKVLDGTLKGYSIGGKVFQKEVDTIKVGTETKAVPRITDYKLTELSLVDNPCNTECNVALVKSVDDSLEMTDVLENNLEVDDMKKAATDLKDFSQKWDGVQLLVTFEKLQSTLHYVLEDIIFSDASAEDKEKLLKKSVKQFQITVENMIPSASKLYSKFLDDSFYADLIKKLNSEGGEHTVKQEISKKMEQVTTELKKSAEEATEVKEEVKEEVKGEATEVKEEVKEEVVTPEVKEEVKKEVVEEKAVKAEDNDVEKRFNALEKQITDLTSLVTASIETKKSDEVGDLKKSVTDLSKQVTDFFGKPAERKAVVVEKEYTTGDTETAEVKKAAADESIEKKAIEIGKLTAKRKAGEALSAEEEYTINKFLDESLAVKLNKLSKA